MGFTHRLQTGSARNLYNRYFALLCQDGRPRYVASRSLEGLGFQRPCQRLIYMGVTNFQGEIQYMLALVDFYMRWSAATLTNLKVAQLTLVSSFCPLQVVTCVNPIVGNVHVLRAYHTVTFLVLTELN